MLMTGPGQRELVGRALAEAAAGRVWSTTVAGGEDTTGASILTWLAETIATGTVNATAATAPVSSLFLVVIVPPLSFLSLFPPSSC